MRLQPIPGHLSPGAPSALSRMAADRTLELDIVLRAYGANLPGGAVAALIAHLRAAGLHPAPLDAAAGVLPLYGSRRAIEAALGVELWEEAGGGFRTLREPVLPRSLSPLVSAVVGLSGERPTGQRAAPRAEAGAFAGYRPPDIAQAYAYDSLPTATTGQRAVLLEFASGFRQQDIDLFCLEMGLPRLVPRVVRIDRGRVGPGDRPQDLEATLDLEWLWAAAQGGEVFFLEAPSGTSDAAFGVHVVDGLRRALSLSPDVVSVSYGDGELLFPPAVLQAIDLLISRLQTVGADTFIAAGDDGAYGLHVPFGPPLAQVDAPADCPHAIAVGGTHLELSDSSLRETAWTYIQGNGAGGGGFSQVFPPTAAQVPSLPKGSSGRGVPDIALDADPLTGYQVVFASEVTVVGGTSVAAPVAAGATLRVRAALGRKALLGPALYGLPSQAFRDILDGDNSYEGVPGYRCGPGWDAVTGRGAPLFREIARAL